MFGGHFQTHTDDESANGISPAKKIMEIHNATIRVISKPNERAAFLLEPVVRA